MPDVTDWTKGSQPPHVHPPKPTLECATWNGTRTYPSDRVRFRPAAYGIAFDGGRVLLGRSAFTSLWDIPGGAVEPWETLVEGMCREFWEETGVHPEPIRLVHFRENFFGIFDRPFHSLRFYYTVRIPADASLRAQTQEITQLTWVDLDEARPPDFAAGDHELLMRLRDQTA